MKEIGKMIKLMDKEYINMQMAQHIKDNGKMTSKY